MIGIIIALCFTVVSVLSLYLFLNRISKTKKHVCVVVLGDIGRSPRMQYHSLSLAKRGWRVDIVGYADSKPHDDVMNNCNIHIAKMKEPPAFLRYFPRVCVYLIKSVWQSVSLLVSLVAVGEPSHVLLQNPPAIPTLAVLWFICALRDCHLVVDWHNYGYTILGLAVGTTHPLYRFSKWYEEFFGGLANSHICVTEAMKKDLAQNWEINAQTMYDRPPEIFRKTSLEEQHELFTRLADNYQVFKSESDSGDVTTFTESSGQGRVTQRESRPALLVSSTSWTEDEDFSILLTALAKYEEAVTKNTDLHLPKLVCVITGKGPQKEHYMTLIRKRTWENVQIVTPWLTAEDYPRLLGSADLGVCLHMSSSGLDLPMKVVDMFGCGVPVCAVKFNCIDELVKHEENGLIFSTESELAQQLQDLLTGFPANQNKLQKFRRNLEPFQAVRWEDGWSQNVLPLFQ